MKRKVPINTVISLFKAHGRGYGYAYSHKNVRVADRSDYNCYYMSSSNYYDDMDAGAVIIGFSENVPLEGTQFFTLCVIKQGIITHFPCDMSQIDFALVELYVDSKRGKCIIE